jgi:hypothetical protein
MCLAYETTPAGLPMMLQLIIKKLGSGFNISVKTDLIYEKHIHHLMVYQFWQVVNY